MSMHRRSVPCLHNKIVVVSISHKELFIRAGDNPALTLPLDETIAALSAFSQKP